MFQYRSEIPVAVEELFAWHQRPGALARLIPPWESVELESGSESLKPGNRVTLKMSVGGIPLRWVAEHTELEPNVYFQDKQLSGPFASWLHTHRFGAIDSNHSYLQDEIEYTLPGGAVGDLLGAASIRQKLQRMFQYRHQTTIQDLTSHSLYKDRQTMKIAITGASGLVGSQLAPFLTGGNHEVLPMTRKKGKPGTVHWDHESGEIDLASLEGVDAVIHLAGENIAGSRWNDAVKRKIRDSRVLGTRFLCERLAKLQDGPKSLICASAVGYYGDRGSEPVDENSPPGEGFLVDVCQQWESAADPAREAGIRVAHGRIGVILTPKGGALKQMLTPFKLGGGGVIGSGDQYWSWISIDDVVGGLHHLLMNESLSGPVNLVSPNAVTNREFTKTLGKVLSRPTIIPMPAFAARLALGEMADALLLASQNVQPTLLQQSGYTFRDPELEPALRKLLGKQS